MPPMEKKGNRNQVQTHNATLTLKHGYMVNILSTPLFVMITGQFKESLTTKGQHTRDNQHRVQTTWSFVRQVGTNELVFAT